MSTAIIPITLGHAEDPLAAAAAFHADYLPRIRAALSRGCSSLVLQFDHAPEKPHRWRVEAVAALARDAAPVRVNAVAPATGDQAATAISETAEFLHANGGITGQLILVDCHDTGTLGGAR